MLSYQHLYHAGNLADVHKHGALSVLLQRMGEKPRPITYVDTHAGRGLYDLGSAEARKTGEAALGIVKRLKAGAPPPGHPYRNVIEQVRERHGPLAYPGSPRIAAALANPGSTLHLLELHPQEFAALRTAMAETGRDQRIHVTRRDGFEAALELAPPHARRGLVFIDPSFEVKSEYQAAARFVTDLNAKWPEAVIVLWYPLLAAGLHEAMAAEVQNAMSAAGRECPMRREVRFAPGKEGHRMEGSGLLIVNPPYGVDEGLDAVERWLEG